ncbi:MAG: VanZ family protein [Nitrospira sp.]
MGMIFALSTDFGSMTNTNSILTPIIKFFDPEISKRGLILTLIMFRKGAHLIAYATLSILWYSPLNQGRRWSWRSAGLALGISISYAGLDELHQTFVKSRTGVLSDVGIDSFGALLGLGIGFGRSRSECFISVKAKFFGWWFAWGVFSTIMLLIVTQGASLSFSGIMMIIPSIGVLSGTAGVLYHASQR